VLGECGGQIKWSNGNGGGGCLGEEETSKSKATRKRNIIRQEEERIESSKYWHKLPNSFSFFFTIKFTRLVHKIAGKYSQYLHLLTEI
jgi:hypothetical protein